MTFNDNILATSVKASMFTVKYDGKQIGVKSVEVSGKTITINYLNPITIDDYSKTFDVTVTPKTIDDVTYEITSVNGAVYNAAAAELVGISANVFSN